MNATIVSLSPEVREAALDLKSWREKIKEAGERASEWFPAEASARRRMLGLSREQSAIKNNSAAIRHRRPSLAKVS